MVAPLPDSMLERVVQFALAMKARPFTSDQVQWLSDRLVDSLACGVAAACEPEPLRVVDAVLELGGAPRCSIIGGRKASMEQAGYVNGVLIRYLDWNDTYVGKNGGHPSDLVSVALAAGECSGKTGIEVLQALAAGTHFMLDMCDAADAFARGWDHSTYTGMAGSLVAGLLLDLTANQLGHALAMTIVSGNMLIGRSGRVSHWKNLAAPHAARNALFCAHMARHSVTGPSPIFEGPHGFLKHISGPMDIRLDPARDRTGDTFLKRHQAVYHAQGPIEIALRVRGMYPELGEDALRVVKKIRLETYAFAVKWAAADADCWQPPNRETADHSIPFLVGLALVKGHVDSAAIESGIVDEGVLEMTRRIEVLADQEFTSRWPMEAPVRMTIDLGTGTTVDEISAPFGHADRPMPSRFIEGKFLSAASKLVGREKAETWLRQLRGFAGSTDRNACTTILAAPS